jgi:glycosyltransferase involved in cell wall biosynthesis
MTPLRVVVYPHTMEIGGSQLNAVELAAAVRDLGHEVILYAPDGALVPYARELGLEHVRAATAPFHPAPSVTADLARLVAEREIDVLHGYEWPPALEMFAVRARRPSVAAVATVMSMAVPPFLPPSMPLVVGTQRLARSASGRSGGVHLIEPPVDTVANRPDVAAAEFRSAYPAEAGTGQVVVVSRLAHELKLSGILAAVRAVGELSRRRAVRLVIVGDGPAAGEVRAAAEGVNRAAGRPVVLMTGALTDPRGAYDAADVCLGMGGSALRALAFRKPLVVQGEQGFFEVLTPANVEVFLEQGWYGVDDRSPEAASDHLAAQLEGLLGDPARRAELGRFGRELVDGRFSLAHAAELQVEIYRRAVRERAGMPRVLAQGAVAAGAVVGHKLRRRVRGLFTDVARDDFNAQPA